MRDVISPRRHRDTEGEEMLYPEDAEHAEYSQKKGTNTQTGLNAKTAMSAKMELHAIGTLGGAHVLPKLHSGLC